MKILHIAESAKGGVGTYLADVVAAQAGELGPAGVRALVPQQHADQLSGVDRRLVATWQRRDRSAGSVAALAAAVRREVAGFRPTIVHLHSSVAGVVVRLMYGWRRPAFGIVYCPHGWAFDRRAGAVKNRLIERIERSLAPAADRIVMISEHERLGALRIGIDPARLAMVLNGVSDQPVPPPARWVDDRLKVLFVGRLDEQKGIDTLLDAAEPLRDRVALRIIGEAIAGPGAIRRGGNGTQVQYLGWRSPAEIATEIAAADVVAVPSRWEGFGLVALEAMRGGRAVVASAVGGLQEIVADGETGRLVPPNSPERLMRVLVERDRAAWLAMGAAGRRRYEDHFTAERMNRELLALYRELPARRGAGRPLSTAHA